jgi:RarD protein
MMISSMIVFGSIGIFRRNLPLSSALISASRGLIGGLFILVFTLLTRKGAKERIAARKFFLLALTGAVIGINWMLLFESFNHTTIGIAMLCFNMQPTIVVLLSPIIFKERLTAKKLICAAIAIFGMAMVSGVIGSTEAQNGSFLGVQLGLMAAVCYSFVVIMNKKIVGVDTYRKTTIQLLFAGIVMLPYLLLKGGFGNEVFSPKTIILILILGIVHTGVSYLLYFGSMDGLRAQTVAISGYIEPVAALVFSALLLKEPLSVTGFIGAVMIIGSAIISESGEQGK